MEDRVCGVPVFICHQSVRRTQPSSQHEEILTLFSIFHFRICMLIAQFSMARCGNTIGQLDILLAVNFAPSTIWHTLNRQNRKCVDAWCTLYRHNVIHIQIPILRTAHTMLYAYIRLLHLCHI